MNCHQSRRLQKAQAAIQTNTRSKDRPDPEAQGKSVGIHLEDVRTLLTVHTQCRKTVVPSNPAALHSLTGNGFLWLWMPVSFPLRIFGWRWLGLNPGPPSAGKAHPRSPQQS